MRKKILSIKSKLTLKTYKFDPKPFCGAGLSGGGPLYSCTCRPASRPNEPEKEAELRRRVLPAFYMNIYCSNVIGLKFVAFTIHDYFAQDKLAV